MPTLSPDLQGTTRSFPRMGGRFNRRVRILVGIVVLLVVGLGIRLAAVYLSRDFAIAPAAVATRINLGPTVTEIAVHLGWNDAELVLPDGTVWGLENRYLHPGQITQPFRPLAFTTSWRTVARGPVGGLGLRRDGSLWAMDTLAGDTLSGSLQVGTNRDWIEVAANGVSPLALRRDGSAWEIGRAGGVFGTGMRQIGPNRPWARLCSGYFSGTVGLDREGSLWALENHATPSSFPAAGPVPQFNPLGNSTQWTELWGGEQVWARNAKGEIWSLGWMPTAPPSPGTFLVAAQGRPDRFAMARVGHWAIYEVRNDGSLWKTNAPIGPPRFWPAVFSSGWSRVGNRSDWVRLWGTGSTAIGLTRDGTIWIWGQDPRFPSPPDLNALWAGYRAFLIRLAPFLARWLPSPANSRIIYPVVDLEPVPLAHLIPSPGAPLWLQPP